MPRRPSKRGGVRRNRTKKILYERRADNAERHGRPSFLAEIDPAWLPKKPLRNWLSHIYGGTYEDKDEGCFFFTEGQARVRRDAIWKLARMAEKHGLLNGFLGLVEVDMRLAMSPEHIELAQKHWRAVRLEWGSKENWERFRFIVAQVMENPDVMKDKEKWEECFSGWEEGGENGTT